MKLELKNITYYKQGSQETPCYNADVYINGKKAIHVSNNGCGGSDSQYMHEPFTFKDLMEVQDYLHKKSKIDHEPLESWCWDQVYDDVDKKSLKKELQKKYLCVVQDDYKDERFLMSWKRRGKDFDESFQKYLVAKEPDLVGKCLNFLPFDKAWKIYEEVMS